MLFRYSNLKIVLLAALVFIGLGCSSSDDTDVPNDENPPEQPLMDVMSFNIRGDQTSDGENQWEFRKEKVVDLIKKYNPAIMGLQEARPSQLEYIKNELGNYSILGGGSVAGEFTVILFNPDILELVQGSNKSIWLSETPNVRSIGWDALHVRILIYATFREKTSGKEFLFLNTHLDHLGAVSRDESARLIVSTIQSNANDKPVILLGDFNSTQNHTPYSILTAPQADLKNARIVSQSPHKGPLTRSAGFSVANHSSQPPIDFIFVNSKIKVLTHAFITDSHNGFYPSDHLPVLSGIDLL